MIYYPIRERLLCVSNGTKIGVDTHIAQVHVDVSSCWVALGRLRPGRAQNGSGHKKDSSGYLPDSEPFAKEKCRDK